MFKESKMDHRQIQMPRTRNDGVSITEIASQLGTTSRALRHYESKGLLAPTRNSRRARIYTAKDRAAAERIVLLRDVGLSLEEIRCLELSGVVNGRDDLLVGMLHRRRDRLLKLVQIIDDMVVG
ncbi:zinc-responsive transcriptional regulator [compost metagenome]